MTIVEKQLNELRADIVATARNVNDASLLDRVLVSIFGDVQRPAQNANPFMEAARLLQGLSLTSSLTLQEEGDFVDRLSNISASLSLDELC